MPIPAVRLFWRLCAFALVALGMATSAYLLALHFAISSRGSKLFDICKEVFGANCDAAIRSEWAVQLGIPLAGWGVVQFVVVGVALLLALVLGDTFRSEGTLAAMSVCGVAAVLGLVLTGMMVSGAAAFCPLCVVVHVVNLLLIPVIPLATGQTIDQLGTALGRGLRYLLGARAVDPILVRWKLTGLVTAALLGIVSYQWILIQADRAAVRADRPPTFEEVLAEFENGPEYEIPVGDEDPRLGDAQAGLQLVLFSDFQCPACRRFAQMLAAARQHHPELAVVFKHYPLGKECNPGVRSDLHPLSCGAAYAAEAARRQGKFWEYHNALFASPEEFHDDLLETLARDIGLDLDQFHAERADAAAKAKVEADVALGEKLDLVGTPTAFLNNRLVPVDAMSMLDELIEHESGHRHE